LQLTSTRNETTGSTTRLYVLGLVAERFLGGTTITRFYDYQSFRPIITLSTVLENAECPVTQRLPN
jgi:hypothetical protein